MATAVQAGEQTGLPLAWDQNDDDFQEELKVISRQYLQFRENIPSLVPVTSRVAGLHIVYWKKFWETTMSSMSNRVRCK